MLKKLFCAHPASVGETYFEHMGQAISFSLALMGAGLACFFHAFLPWCFQRTGRDTIQRLHRRMVTHRGAPSGHENTASAGVRQKVS